MSEYIEVEVEETDDPNVLIIETNMQLTTEAAERYASAEAMAEGSPVAQALSVIPGIVMLQLERERLTIERDPYYDWYSISEDVRAVLIDFFL